MHDIYSRVNYSFSTFLLIIILLTVNFHLFFVLRCKVQRNSRPARIGARWAKVKRQLLQHAHVDYNYELFEFEYASQIIQITVF